MAIAEDLPVSPGKGKRTEVNMPSVTKHEGLCKTCHPGDLPAPQAPEIIAPSLCPPPLPSFPSLSSLIFNRRFYADASHFCRSVEARGQVEAQGRSHSPFTHGLGPRDPPSLLRLTLVFP